MLLSSIVHEDYPYNLFYKRLAVPANFVLTKNVSLANNHTMLQKHRSCLYVSKSSAGCSKVCRNDG